MNVNMIANLGDDEFEDELKENLVPNAEAGNWDLFIAGTNVRRTLTVLEEMQTKVDMQLEKHGDEDEEWYRRANNFKRIVGLRIKHVNRAIHALDGSHAEKERKLRAFAHELCVALDKSNMAFAMDDIMFPFGGDEALSAGAWFDRRLEKRAAMSGNPLDEILDGLAVAA
jgi:hypothetical protein